jgi:hypothetical protein
VCVLAGVMEMVLMVLALSMQRCVPDLMLACVRWQA